MIPKRRKQPKMGVRTKPKGEFPGHQKWVRGRECMVEGCYGERIEFAHYSGPEIPECERAGRVEHSRRVPHDKWGLPLCWIHHEEQHKKGWPAFARHYRLKPAEVAQELPS